MYKSETPSGEVISNPSDGIIKFANDEKIELIVMGTTGLLDFQRLYLVVLLEMYQKQQNVQLC